MKEFLAYVGVRAGMGLLGALPGSLVRRLGSGFGRLWAVFDRGRRAMATRHMRRVLGDDARVEEAAIDVMRAYGRYYAEALWARAHRVEEMLAVTRVDGMEHLLHARDEGTGMIFALPHMGNWEAAAPIAVSEGIPVVAVAEMLANRRITDWFTDMRADFGIEVVLATGRVEVMRRLEAAIGENKAVALLCDRDLKRRGVEVEFFGEMTTLPPGPATIAVRTGAPLLPVGCYFDGGGYRVMIKPPLPVPELGSRSDKVTAMTQALAAELEKIISEEPRQWHLVVPNWPSDSEA